MNPTGTIRIWVCACGQLNYYPSDYEFFCTGCRFDKPIVDRVYLAVEVKR